MIIYLTSRMIPSYIQKMALAIMEFEGYKEGSVSARNNNPGNLRWSNNNIPWNGATGRDDRNHVIFATFAAGWNALIRQLQISFNNQSGIYNDQFTLYQFFQKYAEENQKPYAEYVARQLGVFPTDTLKYIKENVV